jgi:hypothetical protein
VIGELSEAIVSVDGFADIPVFDGEGLGRRNFAGGCG